jgi:DNA-binding MarR family transcriptional regulator/GNAT superfamily N-acetyltransferase
MSDAVLARRVEAVRRFNRFYTRQVGLLDEHLVRSPFSLSEARVLHEIAHHEETTATALARELRLDLGYLSRILRGFERKGLIEKRPSSEDRRQQLVSLSEAGENAYAALNAASHAQVESMLSALAEDCQERVVGAMTVIQESLAAPPEHRVSWILRPHQPGDMGWVVHRHGVLYNQEYGFDERFEALVAEIVARFIHDLDPKRERCWIAEREGENVGSVFLVKHPDRPGVARLRLLLVEPRARGLGVGGRLVHECTRFARQAGYGTITLWTNSVLHAARRLYENEGYRLVDEEPHHSYGVDLLAQDWELDLRPSLQPAPSDRRAT